MDHQLSEFQLFKKHNYILTAQDDNASVNSLPLINLVEASNAPPHSSRSTSEQLQVELALQKQRNARLQSEHQQFVKKYQLLEKKYEQIRHKLSFSLEQGQVLRKQLSRRVEKQRGTKGKLKQWIAQAKKNLQQ